MKMALRGILTVGMLWGFFFAIGMALTVVLVAIEPSYAVFGFILPVAFALFFVALQFAIGPIVMDFTLRWVYQAHWIAPNQLPSHLAEFVIQKQHELGFSLKRVTIIEDLNPNAFTYGHFRKNARLVITQGIFEFLDEDEQKAVVAHELGHVANLDFVWVTLAYAIPTLFYALYLGSREVVNNLNRRTKSSSDDDTRSLLGGIAAFFFVVMIISYIVYQIGRFLALFVSRTREYLADDFSAEHTKEPAALSDALVKIAYGMFIVESKRKAFKEKQKNKDVPVEFSSRELSYFQRGARPAISKAFNPLGIFDMKMSRKMALNAICSTPISSMEDEDLTEKVMPRAVAKAAAWDLYNPWGKVMEIQSTHPLPAKRLKRLNDHAVKLGQDPPYPEIGEIRPPESLWDEFFIDVIFGYGLGWLILIFGIILGPLLYLISSDEGAGFTTSQALFINGLIWLILGLAWWYRKTIRYPKVTREHPKVRLIDALTDLTKNGYYESSPVRGKPICVEGTLIGRGIAGYMFSEDLMIRDETGVAIVDYQALFPLWNWYFAWRRVPEILGQEAIVWGWYYRTPYPVIKVWRMWVPNRNRYFKNWWAGLNQFIAIVFLLIGIALIIVGVLAGIFP